MRLDNYVYWKDMHGDPNGNYWGNDFLQDAGLRAPLDTWMCVETMAKLNDPVTTSNGELAFCMDGAKKNYLGPGFPRASWMCASWPTANGSALAGSAWHSDRARDIN